MKDIIEKFKKETGYTLEEKNGRLYYSHSIDLGYTEITSLPEGLIVGGSLDLRGTKITRLPEELIVGGALDLEEVEITSLPKGLIVGEYLYIKGTKITSLPEGLIVGGDLFLPDTDITDTSNVKKNAPTLYQWKNTKYIKCDGIFNEVISHHGNVYKVIDIGKTKEYYLVGDGNGKWAHGDTIEEARRDLLYKISNRDKSEYKKLTLNSILSYEEAIECYRVITGACSAGTKGFCENELTEKKEYYSIKEIISLTKGKYGNVEFKKFFS